MRRSGREYWLLAEALAAASICRAGLLLLPVGAVSKLVRFLLGGGRPLPAGRRCPREQVIRAAVSGSLHSPVGETCLSTALVARAMLERHGHEARLCLGVRRSASGIFGAHAWLESGGRVVVGGTAEEIASYVPLPEMERLIR